MRTAFAAAVLLGSAVLAAGQPPKDAPAPEPGAKDPPRYGVRVRIKQYPQNTPKEALKSVVAAAEGADFGYLVSHLLDPKFVDDAVAERAKLLEPVLEVELAQLRDFQRANPTRFEPENRVPLDPKGLRAMAGDRARDRGYKQLVKDVEKKLVDDPQSLREMRKIARDGMFAEADAGGAATHPDVKGRTAYFKRVGDRWFLENRQTDEPAKKEP